MLEAHRICIQKYATFQGRARRSEYWYFFLCSYIIRIVLSIISYTCVFSGVPLMITLGLALSMIYLLFPNAPGVSRVRCMFHADGQSIQMQDLRSSYGTFLANGLKLDSNTSSPIQRGSKVFIGSRNIAVSDELISA